MRRKIDTLDDLDLRIVGALRLDGRKSYRELARELDIAEATIRKRLKRLRSQGLLHIVALVDPKRVGYALDVAVHIRADLARVGEIVRTLRAMPQVRYVAHVAGPYDILIVLSLLSQDALRGFMTETLGEVPGVRHAETAVILQIVKRTYDFWPLPA